jgi:hypothetical protein
VATNRDSTTKWNDKGKLDGQYHNTNRRHYDNDDDDDDDDDEDNKNNNNKYERNKAFSVETGTMFPVQMPSLLVKNAHPDKTRQDFSCLAVCLQLRLHCKEWPLNTV